MNHDMMMSSADHNSDHHDHGSSIMMDNNSMMMDMMPDDTTTTSSFCKSNGMIMYMDGFHVSLLGGKQQHPCLNLLFSNWTLNTRYKFIFAMIITFCFAIGVEGLAKFRHEFVRTIKSNNNSNNNNNNRMLNWIPLLQTNHRRLLLRWVIPILHGIQALTGYMLMLITMTFSVELLLCVVTGLATGYGIFFKLNDDDTTNNNNDYYLEQHVTANPCCEFMQDESRDTTTTIRRHNVLETCCEEENNDDNSSSAPLIVPPGEIDG